MTQQKRIEAAPGKVATDSCCCSLKLQQFGLSLGFVFCLCVFSFVVVVVVLRIKASQFAVCLCSIYSALKWLALTTSPARRLFRGEGSPACHGAIPGSPSRQLLSDTALQTPGKGAAGAVTLLTPFPTDTGQPLTAPEAEVSALRNHLLETSLFTLPSSAPGQVK